MKTQHPAVAHEREHGRPRGVHGLIPHTTNTPSSWTPARTAPAGRGGLGLGTWSADRKGGGPSVREGSRLGKQIATEKATSRGQGGGGRSHDCKASQPMAHLGPGTCGPSRDGVMRQDGPKRHFAREGPLSGSCYAHLKFKAMHGGALTEDEMESVGTTVHWHDTGGGRSQPNTAAYEIGSTPVA